MANFFKTRLGENWRQEIVKRKSPRFRRDDEANETKMEIKRVMFEKPEDMTHEECQEAFALFRKQRSRAMKIKQSTIFGIPYVSEQIFEGLSDHDLIES